MHIFCADDHPKDFHIHLSVESAPISRHIYDLCTKFTFRKMNRKEFHINETADVQLRKCNHSLIQRLHYSRWWHWETLLSGQKENIYITVW